MFVWTIERTDYETEGCPEHSSWVEEVVIGEDWDDVRERAEARAEELHAGAYALTSYYASPVDIVVTV
jgi:hypothetical protein